MILSDFRNYVWYAASRLGTPYIQQTDLTSLNNMLQEILNVYAAKTNCFYSESVSFTPIVGQAIYHTFNASTNQADYLTSTTTPCLTTPMCSVDQVFINGTPLEIASSTSYNSGYGGGGMLGNYSAGPNRYGPSQEIDVIRLVPNYLTATNGSPLFFFEKSPNTIRFSCPFDQVYSNCWFSGRLYHTALNALAIPFNDNQVLDLAPEDIEPCAMLARLRLIRPLNPDVAMQLKPEVDMMIRERFAACSTKSSNPQQRGAGWATLDVDTVY